MFAAGLSGERFAVRNSGANAVIEANVTIGERTRIGASSVIGRNAVIGVKCRIHPRGTIYHECKLGNRVGIFS